MSCYYKVMTSILTSLSGSYIIPVYTVPLRWPQLDAAQFFQWCCLWWKHFWNCPHSLETSRHLIFKTGKDVNGCLFQLLPLTKAEAKVQNNNSLIQITKDLLYLLLLILRRFTPYFSLILEQKVGYQEGLESETRCSCKAVSHFLGQLINNSSEEFQSCLKYWASHWDTWLQWLLWWGMSLTWTCVFCVSVRAHVQMCV